MIGTNVARRPATPPTNGAARLRGGTPRRADGTLVTATHDDLKLFVGSAVLAAPLLAGIALGNGSLMLGGAALALIAAVVSPAVGLMLLALTTPHLAVPVLPAPGFPFVLSAATVAGCIFRLPIDRRPVTVTPTIVLLVAAVAYLLAHLPVTLLTHHGEEARFVGSLMAKLTMSVLVVIGAGFVLRDRSPYPFVGALLLSAAAEALLAVVAFQNAPVTGPLAHFITPSDSDARPSASFGDPNEFGLFISMAIVTAISWFATTRRRPVRTFLACVLICLSLGLLVAQSRTAIIALVAGLAAMGFVRSRRTGVAILGLSVAVGLLLYPLLIEARLTNSLGTASGTAVAQLAVSDSGRLGLVLAGPMVFLSSPVFGIGLGGYHFAIGDSSHDWFMTILVEQGVVGISLWLLILVTIFLALRRRPSTPRGLGLSVLSAFVAGSFFLNPPYVEQSIVFTAMILTAAVVANWEPALSNGPNDSQPLAKTSSAHPVRAKS